VKALDQRESKSQIEEGDNGDEDETDKEPVFEDNVRKMVRIYIISKNSYSCC
jgi:hypothetical protein